VASFALTNLLLDVTNPRFETEQQNQRDAINRMAVEQGDKILNLAEDIVQFGVDPSSLPLVIAADDGIKQIVVEGNRRIVALKLLHNPQLAPEVWSAAQEKKLKELSQQFKSIPPSTNRNTLIPRVCTISIKETKSNNIYHELRRIHLDQYPFAIAVLFRVFLELSVDHYIIEKKLKTIQELDQMKMRAKLELAASNLESKGSMTRRQANTLRSFGNPQKFLAASIDNFHAYVHDSHFSAGRSDLISAWDSLELFFKKFL